MGLPTAVGCHFLLGDLPDPGMEPASPVAPVLAGRSFSSEISGKLNPGLSDSTIQSTA